LKLKNFVINVSMAICLIFSLGACNMEDNALDTGVNDEYNDDMLDVGYDNDRMNDDPADLFKSTKTKVPSHKYPHTHAKLIGKGIYKIEIGQRPINFEGKTGVTTPEATKQKMQQPTNQQPKTDTTAPKTETPAQPEQTQKDTTQGISEFERKVIELTNVERKKNGLPALTADTPLSNVARKKSDDMQAKGYFSHTSPTYGSPFDMIRDFGITYKTAGENIAKGQRTPEQVVQGWMGSPGHRKNILSSDFTHIGVGFNEGGNYWTQMFIGK
jgi:uncharacterized YkwD family protein